MSWRETLGVTPSTETPYAHNSQNTQKSTETGNCADIADSAYRDSEQENSKLLEALAGAPAELDEDAREYIAERKAIGEIDGELSRDEAAPMATARIYEFRLTDDPGVWLLMLAKPGDGPVEVAASLRSRFGSERVIEVRPYTIREDITDA